MYDKIKKLAECGLNKSQIALELLLDRETVRKYLNMSESDIMTSSKRQEFRVKKLLSQEGFIHDQLKLHPYFSAAQIEDRLKEHLNCDIGVSSKTVYNYVQYIRQKYDIPKPNKGQREFNKLEESPFGDSSQVDFGHYTSTQADGRRIKVHFFTMVLSRSRYKYVWLQLRPFTSLDAIKAHNLAFAYYEGMPKRVVYDQDRLFLVSENLGDLEFTSEFRNYRSQMGFIAHFCRKSDPQSKGKVENVVKYVKHNFLPGRLIQSESKLNEDCLAWLKRTGNGKEHASTRKIPFEQWLEERTYLQPYKSYNIVVTQAKQYLVRRDNTISYRGNYYSLPSGSYTGTDVWVLVKEQQEELTISDIQGDFIARHTIALGKGGSVLNSDHRRNKSGSLEQLEHEVSNLYSNTPYYKEFIEGLKEQKKRYLRDNLNILLKLHPQFDAQHLSLGFQECISLGVYNGNAVMKVAQSLSAQTNVTVEPLIKSDTTKERELDLEPQKSSVLFYNSMM